MDRKTNSTLIIYSQSSTNPANSAKIGAAEFEIIGLTGIEESLKYFKKYKMRNRSRTQARFRLPGWLGEKSFFSVSKTQLNEKATGVFQSVCKLIV